MTRSADGLTIELSGGALPVREIAVDLPSSEILADGRPVAFESGDGAIRFTEDITFEKTLVIR